MNKTFPLWKIATLASMLGLLINLVIYYFAKPFAPHLISLSIATVTFWTFAGSFGATGTYAFIKERAKTPWHIFVRSAWIVLAISFIPDIALFFVPVPGDINPPVSGVLALMAMHLVVFAVIMSALNKYADRAPLIV